MLFRAHAELYPNLSLPLPFPAAENITLEAPDFDLAPSASIAQFISSDSLHATPFQDRLGIVTVFEPEWEAPRPSFVTEPAWETLWRETLRIPINAVPEPTTLTLAGIGAALVAARRWQKRK